MSAEQSPSIIIPQLIIGLGNPEPKYDKTRHNIGFEVVDALAQAWQLSWKENRRFQGLLAEGTLRGNQKILLLKPLTYMNLSGQSVRAVTDWYKVSPNAIMVVYDDMDLPIGKMRIRLSGSAGGHNGMKSIISHLNSQDFPRLRLGIGKSNHSDATISHVLGKFSPQEKANLNQMFPLVIEAVEMSLKQGVEKAMSLYNNRVVVI
ncbi:aminoacyl-tRNA hydrolase [Aphanothece sacrum]|uniref:Peptidyl-tRNA hydrolase n=1 Tax=Aphanothece sacrum FPU1 TaxID=1920663 RepID=A0A401IIZ3_APHSA|nr:aminoacyl-tRNA hydrolase [Aphanothece sacrum]GBF81150.1 peptidyl-tRNA hydrolase [Aphanothece sacrum FPU1]GBF83502.1 peptidyl-tRNA hydrolase Pth [Aphanothece sacrum FPU3]